MAWVEKNYNDHLVSTPLLSAGSPTTRPGCPEPHAAWPWMPPGMRHPQPPWAACSSVSPPSGWKTSFLPPLITSDAFWLITSVAQCRGNYSSLRLSPVGIRVSPRMETPQPTALEFNNIKKVLFFFTFYFILLFLMLNCKYSLQSQWLKETGLTVD